MEIYGGDCSCTKEAVIAETRADLKNMVGWIKKVEGENMRVNEKIDSMYKLVATQFFVIVAGTIAAIVKMGL